MIDIKVACALLHTPTSIIFVGTYESNWEAMQELKDAMATHIKDNPSLSSNDYYFDTFAMSLGSEINYVITDYDSFIERYKNSGYPDAEGYSAIENSSLKTINAELQGRLDGALKTIDELKQMSLEDFCLWQAGIKKECAE